MKLLHVTPEARILKTGINVTPINCSHHKMLCLYLAIENLGFIGVYFGRIKKTGKMFISNTYSYFCRKTSRHINKYST